MRLGTEKLSCKLDSEALALALASGVAFEFLLQQKSNFMSLFALSFSFSLLRSSVSTGSISGMFQSLETETDIDSIASVA